MTGLSKETLRYFEEEQVLELAFVDYSNSNRYYDDGSIKKQSLQNEISEKQQKISDIEAFIRTGREEQDE